MTHPILQEVSRFPQYDNSKDTTLRECLQPLGQTPTPIVCQLCHYPYTKCEWVAGPKEYRQSTGAHCSRCGSLQVKDSDKKNVSWQAGNALAGVLKMQEKLFCAMAICRDNYTRKPKLILGGRGAGRTSLLHAILADMQNNPSAHTWRSAPILFFGKLNEELVAEYGIKTHQDKESIGSSAHLTYFYPDFTGYDQVEGAVNGFTAAALNILVDADQLFLNKDDIHDRMDWESPLLNVINHSFHQVNLFVALPTSHSMFDQNGPFFVGSDTGLEQLRRMTGALTPAPTGIVL